MPGLGRRPAPDVRDRLFSVRARAPQLLNAPKRYDRVFYRTPPPLDQGNTDECVEFGWQLFIGAWPIYGKLLPRRTIYDLAQSIDEFPDTPPTGGTSVRAGAKALLRLGHLKSYLWIEDFVTDPIKWLQAGAGIVLTGIPWLNSMFTPDPRTGLLRVDWNSREAGGHCIPIVGYDPALDLGNGPEPHDRLQNSWGPGWGDRGRCWIRHADMIDLCKAGGEMVVGVESPLDAV